MPTTSKAIVLTHPFYEYSQTVLPESPSLSKSNTGIIGMQLFPPLKVWPFFAFLFRAKIVHVLTFV